MSPVKLFGATVVRTPAGVEPEYHLLSYYEAEVHDCELSAFLRGYRTAMGGAIGADPRSEGRGKAPPRPVSIA
jgi:hypothetical protein